VAIFVGANRDNYHSGLLGDITRLLAKLHRQANHRHHRAAQFMTPRMLDGIIGTSVKPV
jgi:hypothetical protein